MKTFLVHTERNTALTYDEHEGRLFMLYPYEFACEDLDGAWVYTRIWCDEYQDVLEEAKFNATLFGTGRYRIHKVLFGGKRDDGMWRDENGTLHVTKRSYYNTSTDFRGTYHDYYNERPDLKGKRTFMPPLCLGYSTCLLIEGNGFVIE